MSDQLSTFETKIILFRTSLSTALQDIIDKNHDSAICQHNWRKNNKKFNQVPNNACQFFRGSSDFCELLEHKKFALNVPNTDSVGPGPHPGSSHPNISDFRTQLVLYEDLKDEITIGCRTQEDAKKPENDLQSL